MKKRPADKNPSSDQPDPQRRRISKLIAAATALGTGLGVNMREVFATDARPSAAKGKWEGQAAQQPDAKQLKIDPRAPARPGATQAKPIPARPAAVQDKHHPAAEHTKIEGRPDAGMLKGEARPGADMWKGE